MAGTVMQESLYEELEDKIVVFQSILQGCTLLKTAKLKGCVTSKILIVGPTRPVANIFKANSIKWVAFGITKVFWDCGNAN